MLLRLPNEITALLTEFCPLSSQSSLARTCHCMYGICNQVLYKTDIRRHGSSSVHHAISKCVDQEIAIGTLRAAAEAGSNFNICQEFRHIKSSFHRACHVVMYSPIYLAATKGLDRVVTFLLHRGIPPDGGTGLDITPLFAALLAGEESTAFVLIQAGAVLESEALALNALHAASRAGLRCLSDHLIKVTGLDVNSKTNSGATALTLAVSAGEDEMAKHLIRLGANAFDPLRRACHEHQFAYALQLVEIIIPVREKALQLQQAVELIMFVAGLRTVYGKCVIKALVHKLLTLTELLCAGDTKQSQQVHREISATQVKELLDGLLQRMLSIDRGDADMALLLIQRGLEVRAGTFIEILDALRSSTFEQNKPRLLRQHPKLLKSFHVLYSHCSSIRETDRSWLTNYFLMHVPSEAVDLVASMVKHGVALTAHGVEMMEGSPRPDARWSR